MSRPGDWNCRSCTHLNFQRRESCHRCGEPRFGGVDLAGVFGGRGGGGGGGGFGYATGSDVRPGDWYCTVGNCGTHNFASRSSCFNCGAFKDIDNYSSGGMGMFDDVDVMRFRAAAAAAGNNNTGGRSSWKSGDWICTRLGCNEHNFASRMECFRCNAPRDFIINRTSY